MRAGNRVIFNTGVLYIKLLISLVIGLFTTRLVLAALGETNFGIYTLVAGIAGMLAILQSSMATSSMRFMAHSLGTGNANEIKKTFNSTLYLHIIIGVILIIVMEIGGFLMFDYLLNIPADRIVDARLVFHFMVATTFITIIAVPYDAVINAHENILALSVVDIIGAIIKLGIAIYLTHSSTNLLVLYGLLMFLSQVLMRIIKQWYSRVKYLECKIGFREFVDKRIIRNILSFTGWNIFGSIAAMSVTQVKSILLNMFFGVDINAADGISKTASSQVNLVSVNMTRALNPQLVKSEGSGDRIRMLRITEIATKYSIFLFALIAIPVIIETPYLLNLWLKTVPDYSIIFVRLILIGLLIDKLTFEISSAIRAVGKIKVFTVIESLIVVLNVPVSYLLFKQGHPPYTIFLVAIFFGIVIFFSRLYFGKVVAGLNIAIFIKKALLPLSIPLSVSSILVLLIAYKMDEGPFRLGINFFLSTISMIFLLRYFGLSKNEIATFQTVIDSSIQKIQSLLKHKR